MCAVTLRNLKNVILSERSQVQKSMYYMIPFYEVQKQATLINGNRNQNGYCLKGSTRVIGKAQGETFWDVEIVHILAGSIGYMSVQ